MNGQPWPIFHSVSIGDHPSTLFFYVVMPFQAALGLSTFSVRLPAMLAGIACVPLAFAVGRRLGGTGAGLAAAAVLALNPWHLLVSRLGLGAALCPLQTLLVVWLALRAGFPITDAARPARAGWALAAGLVAGVSAYGFHPMRLLLPLLFAAMVAIDPRGWMAFFQSAGGRRAAIACGLAFAATFGPLAWQHVVDPAIAQRWEMTRLWAPGASPDRIASLVLNRYLQHFGPDFLFLRGDRFEIMNLPRRGAFPLYLAPLMLAGAALAAWQQTRSVSARLLLALVALYPVGDIVSRYEGVHFLRSAPGIPALALLAGSGIAAAVAALRRARRAFAVAACAIALLGAGVAEGRYLARFFGSWNREPLIYHGYHQDLVQACRWIRPRLGSYDAIVWTTEGMAAPFAVTLVELGWDAARWRREPRDIRRLDGFDVVVRYGPNHFLYEDWPRAALDSLQRNGRVERALFVIRPDQLGLQDPVHVIRGPLGEALWLVETEL